jgi:xanthine permease XanP
VAKRPAGLIYGVDDRPPWSVLGLLAVQHLMLISSTLILPVVLVTEIGGGMDQVRAVVALSMVAAGIGTIVQSMRFAGIGSGYLCPNLVGPNFFAASMSAAWAGGLPLMRGMTIAAGLVEAVFARILPRLAFLFPIEITGLVVFMVGIALVPVGASKFLHVEYAGEPVDVTSLLVAAATLALMVGINVWGSRQLRLYGVLIGIVTGYGLAAILGLLTQAQLHDVASTAWIGLPHYEGMWRISFSWSLLPGFAIVSICGALKSFGNLAMCEQANDDDWRAPDLKRIGGGLMADAISVTAAGLLGGLATDTSSSNVSLSGASGATSRWIGYATGGLLVLLGFSPKLAAVLSVMPASVAGAILVFVVCYMVVSGLQMIVGSGADRRKIFVVGIPLCFGLSLDIVPVLYTHVGPWLRPLFESSLTLTVVLAVILNQLLRIGAGQPAAAPPG